MILDQHTRDRIFAAAADVQRAVYYERERVRPSPGDIGAYLQRRELHLISAVMRELWALGWRPPSDTIADTILRAPDGPRRRARKAPKPKR